MESYNIGTRCLLGSLFHHHQKYQRQYYGVILPHLNPNGLSVFLSLEEGKYNVILNTLRMATIGKDGSTLRIKPSAWKSFFTQEGLDNCYFD
jgi:hypothetical protein